MLRFESLVNSSSGKTPCKVKSKVGLFESLVNSSSGKTEIVPIPVSKMFESLVNSSSGKTIPMIQFDRL